MQKVRSHPCGLLLFVCMRFQDLFHSPPGVLFAFPSQYWFAIGRLRVFSLGGWSPHLRAGFHVSRSTSRKLSTLNPISRTGLSPSVAGLSRPFQYRIQYHLQALPISLAATFRISVDFFSCCFCHFFCCSSCWCTQNYFVSFFFININYTFYNCCFSCSWSTSYYSYIIFIYQFY